MTAPPSHKLVSIVIPAWNEAAGLDELARRLIGVMDANPQYRFEVIIIDNGSWDDSWDKLRAIRARDGRFRAAQLTRNFLADGAVHAGLQLASGDAAVMMDADLQDPPELISQFLAEWERGAEIVHGTIESRRGVSWVRKTLARLYYGVMSRLTGGAVRANAGGFRLMDRRVYSLLNRMGEHNRFTRGLSAWGGFRTASVPFQRPARFAGESKVSIRVLLKEGWDGIYAFSYLPLKLPFYFGTVALAAAALGLVALLAGVLPALGAIAFLTVGLFGILFILLGFLGSYVRNITDEVRGRPGYVVRTTEGFDSPPAD